MNVSSETEAGLALPVVALLPAFRGTSGWETDSMVQLLLESKRWQLTKDQVEKLSAVKKSRNLKTQQQ